MDLQLAKEYSKNTYKKLKKYGGIFMSKIPFGNDPLKIEKYKAFWNREEMERPLIGFTLRGFFPLEEYRVTSSWKLDTLLTPDMIKPEDFMDDEMKILKEGEILNDDIIRGDSPAAAVIPWLSGMLGSPLRVLPGNVLGEELNLPWNKLENIDLDQNNPWFKKYIEFIKVLVEKADGLFPVSHAAFRGPSDLIGLLRGTTQSIMDLVDEPTKATKLLERMADIFINITEEAWKHIPLFHGGYFDGMYQLWAPGTIVRLQEDLSGLYSPDLYRQFLQPVDRKIAAHFSNSFIHLHSTSMFLLEAFLEVEEIKCFEINNDDGGPPIEKMIQYFKMVQEAERPLLIRGSFKLEDISLLIQSLKPNGLFLYILAKDVKEIKAIKNVLDMD
jgi:hypothetical protein